MINDKYSYKSFGGQDLREVDPEELNGTTIRGSNFAHQNPHGETFRMADVFPRGMRGVVFERCNLDNVKIPAGNTVSEDCTNKRIQEQNDREDWVIDGDKKPTEPANKGIFEKLGLPTDPKYISETKQTIGLIRITRRQLGGVS